MISSYHDVPRVREDRRGDDASKGVREVVRRVDAADRLYLVPSRPRFLQEARRARKRWQARQNSKWDVLYVL